MYGAQLASFFASITFIALGNALPLFGSSQAFPLTRREEASSVTASNEIWATVIANVGPLVTLVGEQNFKAYLKGCTNSVEYGLYSCAPMGALSAVISVLRLVGFPWVLRLIGRQHERRAQVMMDITPLSTGTVRQQYILSSVEQTETCNPDDEAQMVVRGSTIHQDSGQMLSKKPHHPVIRLVDTARLASRLNNTVDFLNRLRAASEACRQFAISAALYSALEVSDDRAALVPHKLPISRQRLLEDVTAIHKFINVAFGKGDGKPLTNSWLRKRAIALGFEVQCSGVSAPLTLGQPRRRTVFLVGASLIQMVIVAAYLTVLIAGNKSEPTTNVLFALIGYIFTVIGMTVLIWTIARSTFLESASVPPVSVFTAFTSEKQPRGSKVYSTLRYIYFARENFQLHKKMGHLSAFTVTGGFVVMYLGLRQLRWWTVMICAGLTALSALIRSTLSRIEKPTGQFRHYLSVGNTFASFGFSALTKSGTSAKDIWEQEITEPMEEWSVAGPWAERTDQAHRAIRLPEPVAILLRFDDIPDKDFSPDQLAVARLAYQVALRLAENDSFLFRRASTEWKCFPGHRSPLRLSPLILWTGNTAFKASAFAAFDRHEMIGALREGPPGLIACLLMFRRSFAGLNLESAPITSSLGAETTYNGIWDLFGQMPASCSVATRSILEGLQSGRMEGSVVYSPSAEYLCPWVPQLILWLLIVLDLDMLRTFQTTTGKKSILPDLGSLVDHVAEHMILTQHLWFGERWERGIINPGNHRCTVPAEWP